MVCAETSKRLARSSTITRPKARAILRISFWRWVRPVMAAPRDKSAPMVRRFRRPVNTKPEIFSWPMIRLMIHGVLSDFRSHQPSITMRLCWQVLAIAIFFLATPSVAGPFYRMPDGLDALTRPLIPVANDTKRAEPDIDMFAFMSGKCSTLKVAGRDFACRAVAYFHSQQGRANLTIALDDPSDNSHIISFSGETARRELDNNLYELPIDQMLLNSRDRPKVDGLPVPSTELSTGTCKQVGSLATRLISSIACSATDKNGKNYELLFESDGSPITLRRIRQLPVTSENRSPRRIEQRECRHKADIARILPRDWTAYILRCLGEDTEPAPAAAQ